MKAFNVTYKDGRFFEVGTDRTISLSADKEAILIVEKEQDIKFGTQLTENLNLVSSQVKLANVQSDSYQGKFKKIFSAGDKLYFLISIEKQRRLGTVVLLEDLYLYNSRTASSLTFTLYDCICECVSIDGIEMKKSIPSPSVSDLFKKVFVHFRGNQGSPSRNAFTTFFVDPKNSKTTLDWVRSQTKL